MTARIAGQEVSAQVDVLVWSDIVRNSTAQTIPATYLQLLQTAWIYIATGTLRRLMWMRKGPVIAALYPVLMLLGQLAAGLGAGLFVGGHVGRILPRFIGTGDKLFFTVADWSIWTIEWALLAVITVTILRWFKYIDNKLFAYYLMNDYEFSAHCKGAIPPALAARMADFGDSIAEALSEDIEEVLIVGHSSGAHLAVSILADLIRDGRVPIDGPKLAFL